MGWSRSRLCLTRNRLDQIGSPKPGLADGSNLGGQMSAVCRLGIGRFRFYKNRRRILFMLKIIAEFRRNLWFLLDLTESQRDLGGFQRDQARSRRDPTRS